MCISRRICEIAPSGTIEINAKVAELRNQGVNIISFSVGEPDFNTPSKIITSCLNAMNMGYTKYTPVNGILPLREAICNKLKIDNNLTYNVEDIVITTGAKQAIYSAVQALINPGDEVIVPTPCWVSYIEIVKLAGGIPVLVDCPEELNFQLNIRSIKQAITKRTKAIIINTPNNPTGAVYTRETLSGLADLVLENDLYVISDEVYEKLIYNDKKHICIASFSEEIQQHTIVINGFSKSSAMTGWRIGYSASARKISKSMATLQGHMTSNCTSFVQYAAISALTECNDETEKMRKEFDKRREFLIKKLRDIDGIECADCDGAFYLLPNVSSFYNKQSGNKIIKNSYDLCSYLLTEAHVAVVPGDAFQAPSCIRVSYSNSMSNLMEGIEKIRQALCKLI